MKKQPTKIEKTMLYATKNGRIVDIYMTNMFAKGGMCIGSFRKYDGKWLTVHEYAKRFLLSKLEKEV